MLWPGFDVLVASEMAEINRGKKYSKTVITRGERIKLLMRTDRNEIPINNRSVKSLVKFYCN